MQESEIQIPPAVRRSYAQWDWRIAWQGAPETITWRLSHRSGLVHYLKLAPTSWFPSLLNEASRMRWAQNHLPVPVVIGVGSEGQVDWLITEALPGSDATDEALKTNPDRLIELLATGLRQMHQTSIDDCPFVFDLDTAIAHVEHRAASGLIDPVRDFHPEHQHLTVASALDQLLRDRPAREDIVVCHGDYCFPNVLIEDDAVVGFLDLGELGMADRWWDLAVATWSTTWNLGGGYEAAFLEAYEIDVDLERIAYYRLLYDLVS